MVNALNSKAVAFFRGGLAGVFVCMAAASGYTMPAPSDLSVGEGFRNPIGFYDATPLFSWRLPPGAVMEAQGAYRIVAATREEWLPEQADLWDSGSVESGQSVWISYGGKPLGSRQEVFWQVKYWDDKGRESEWSEPALFELGLLVQSDWQARWIGVERLVDAAAGDRPPSATPAVRITRATYGAPGDAGKQVDATAKLVSLVAAGNLEVKADNELAGDPAFGTVKELVIEYQLDGETRRCRIAEGQTVDLLTGELAGNAKGGNSYTPQYLRREFELKPGIRRARLYVTAKGLYEVYLNGARVGADFMVPGWTPYDTRIETLTYDVTGSLREGPNAIGAMLGEGWYAGPMMRKSFKYPQARPRLLVQLEVLHDDGEITLLVSDANWRGTDRGPIRFSSIYHGENYDARLEMPGWHEVGFKDDGWGRCTAEPLDEDVKLTPKRHSAVGVTEEVATVAITEPDTGKYVFDLGQNIVGWPRLRIPVTRDRTVTVRFAEMLNRDGSLYTANYRAARSMDTYTPAVDGMITWSPTFTFHGFRYVELSGVAEGPKPKPGWVTGMVLHSRFKQTGRFRCSHAKLNQLQRNITWGQRGNFLDIPTDCPQRDERLGWTGDAQVFCPTSIFNYDVLAFWMSWLQSVREEQNPDGLIDHVVPQTGCGSGSPGWGDVGVVSPWDVYVRTGHREVLEENYEMMKRWVGAYEKQANQFIVARRGFGDWLQPHPVSGNTRGDTPMDLIATAYFGRCAGIVRDAAAALGQEGDAKRYAALFLNIRTAFSKRFFNDQGRLTTRYATQTGYLMALGYDLLPVERRPGAVEGLLECIEAAGGHLRTGFLGTPLLAPVLTRFGHADVAYGILFKETYPSWFFSINQGATTMWERWNSYSHAGGFGNAGMNSFNHYAYGAIGQWMYERVAGLAPDPANPGYRHFFIQPLPCVPLTGAAAELDTPYGIARSRWEIRENELRISLTVPPNTSATFVPPPGAVPQGPRKLIPGDHQLVLRTAAEE